MKVLFLTNIPSPYRVSFFQELGKLCELTVLYEKKEAADRDKKWKKEEKEIGYREIYLKSVYENADNAFCPEIRKYLKKDLYDVIVVGVYSTPTGMYAVRYMKRKKIPYWISCDGGMIPESESRLKYRIKHYFLSDAEGYMSSGEICDGYLEYYGADKGCIYHYPFTSLDKTDMLAAPLDDAARQRQRKELGMTEQFIFLSAGQFIYRKGYDLLLDAAPILSGATGVYIVGGEPTEEYLRQREKLKLEHVHFVGFQDKDTLKKYYQAADVFVLPTREDIWGLVINEAMSNALPVITTDRCAAGLELVDGNGMVIPANSVEELKKALKRYEAISKEELEKEAKRSLENIKAYSIDNMAAAYYETWRRLQKS